MNIARLKFKLGETNNFLLCGVKISDKSKLADFKTMELLQVSSSFAKGSLPVSFTLNIEAKNPNTGKTDTRKQMPPLILSLGACSSMIRKLFPVIFHHPYRFLEPLRRKFFLF
ncbi:MAG: hypothetical protein ACM34J_10780, partial [Ignavibacteria bacterium]